MNTVCTVSTCSTFSHTTLGSEHRWEGGVGLVGLTCEEEEGRRQRWGKEEAGGKEGGREGRRAGGRDGGNEGGREGRREEEEDGLKYKLLCTIAYNTKSYSQTEEWNESVNCSVRKGLHWQNPYPNIIYWGSQSLYPFMYWSTLGRNYDTHLRLGMRYEAEICTTVISMN